MSSLSRNSGEDLKYYALMGRLLAGDRAVETDDIRQAHDWINDEIGRTIQGARFVCDIDSCVEMLERWLVETEIIKDAREIMKQNEGYQIQTVEQIRGKYKDVPWGALARSLEMLVLERGYLYQKLIDGVII